MNFFSNPEILRNARIQLRPRKLAVAAVLCAAISIALGYAYSESADGLGGGFTHNGLLHTILIIQGIALVIGGGIACLHAVQREKDQNTFDFQRITRLSPLELTLGKLFGAPLMPFFVFLLLSAGRDRRRHLCADPRNDSSGRLRHTDSRRNRL